ncbi:MAG TPA: hypothetical protein VK065_08650 [Brevibacterium sp.]|nr:hypothetical protein [Brevibacterium sp.]
MLSDIVSCRFTVHGIRTDKDVKKALQSLYDIFADHGIGQATFEVTGDDHAELIVKHLSSVEPDTRVIDEALARAGDFHVVSSQLRR